MTHAKANGIILSILLMINCQLYAQEEFTETSTEFTSTEFTSTQLPTSTLPPESDSIYVTCDFDLENIESLLPYLPDICTEIFYNRTDSDLYALYLEEALHFGKFYKKLNDYELRDQLNGDNEELTEYPFETKLRYDAYSKIDWTQCLTLANTSTVDYLNCLKDKRLELTDLIPSVNEK